MHYSNPVVTGGQKHRHTQSGQPLGQFMYGGRRKLAKLNYMDIKQMLDRRILQNKKGTLMDREIRSLVKAWHNKRTEDKLKHHS
jgi:hypothetical protein